MSRSPVASLSLGVALGMGAVLVYELLLRRRERQLPGGFLYVAESRCWEVQGYDDVCELLKSPNIRANYLPSFLSQLPAPTASKYRFLADFFGRWPLFQDGQRQRRTHAVLARLFGAQRLSFLETIVNEEVEAILDGIEQGGEEWNAVDDFAKPLPLRIIIRALGFAPSDEEDFKRWADDIEEWFGGQGDVERRFERCQDALQEFSNRAQTLLSCIESSAKSGGGGLDGSIAQELLAASAKGDLEREDVVPNLFFLMSAGHETTASLISNGLLLCFDHPALLRDLRRLAARGREADESQMELERVVKEMLRVVTPVTRAYRQVGTDFTYNGVQFRQGEQVQFNLETANSDTRAFGPDATRFRAARSSEAGARAHLAFGYRDHLCPGLNLGRMTTKAALTSVLRRFACIELTVPRAQVRRLPLDSINALVSLPVRTRRRRDMAAGDGDDEEAGAGGSSTVPEAGRLLESFTTVK